MRRRFRLAMFSRRRVWRNIRTTLSEMRLQGGGCVGTMHRHGCFQEDSRSGRSSRFLENGRVVVQIAAGAISIILPVLISRDWGRFGPLLLVSSVQGLKLGSEDPLAPTREALMEAGLSCAGDGDLELPVYSAGVGASGATNVLTGSRYGRQVRSGILRSANGRILVRTGISSTPPAYSCQLRDGHLLSYNSPVEVSSILLSGRTGPGRVSIVNDGEWLVIERLLWNGGDADSAWLLLRQLRDISMAEMLCVPREITYLSGR